MKDQKDTIIATATATAGHDLSAGDTVYIEWPKKHWFKRFILKLAFWHKPVPIAYKIGSVTSYTLTYKNNELAAEPI